MLHAYTSVNKLPYYLIKHILLNIPMGENDALHIDNYLRRDIGLYAIYMFMHDS